MSKFRKKMSKGKSKRLFTKTAKGANKKNFVGAPMRGGIRL